MCDNASLKEIGIREGEKLHEVMVTKDDSRTTYEYDKHNIIYPHFEWWDFDKYFTKGGLEYNSGSNKEWFNVENLREELKHL